MISIDRAIYIMNLCRATHKIYADYPEECSGDTGDVEHNKKWVIRYEEVIELLEAIKADKSKKT